MYFKFDDKLTRAAERAQVLAAERFAQTDRVTELNQQKLLSAFINNKVSESHFVQTTGYGYGDRGRETLDRVFADVFGAEDAIVRYSLASGTHTIATALFGVLRPGDTLLIATGRPYDTLIDVIGVDGKKSGSLLDFGINHKIIPLRDDGAVDMPEVLKALAADPTVKAVYIQRSRGYTLRSSLSVEAINAIAAEVKAANPKMLVLADNCYGEFVEEGEPCPACDLIFGSLIKNPGGGIAPGGGYIAGTAALVEKCAERLTTASTGREIGATLGHNRELFMGIFNAPHAVGEALKTAIFAAALFEELGYRALPRYDEPRADIVQTIMLNSDERLIAFCRGLQSGAPVDAFVTPYPWDMPGYDCQVIMAAGTFTGGASIELSGDAPLREPYAVWMQGGLNYHSGKIGVMLAAQAVLDCDASGK